MKKLLIVDDDAAVVTLLKDLLKGDDVAITSASDGADGWEKIQKEKFDLLITDVWMPRMNGLELLAKVRTLPEPPFIIVMSADDTPEVLLNAARQQAHQFVSKPFKAMEMLDLIRDTLSMPAPRPIEVISARPGWVELLVPCEIRSVDRIHGMMMKLKADLPEDVRESVSQAFRELLLNAIEWGGELDATRQVRISYLRARRMLLYRITDPGKGFNFEGLQHAAVSNPPDDPIGHMKVREEKGLRPGGLGILMTMSLVDELLYNEAQNEVVFIKYLD
ncbi:MAG: tcrA 2 [Candidatus Angelobacter sp.]|jgi:CheY-like chemotaxis protein|nr:tcrA 2 [Candidatus Angelobacter sp.]